MTESLTVLVAQAINLAGGGTCAAGHDWVSDGGRQCPRYEGMEHCSQTAYRCARCGALDFGEPGGPGHDDCHNDCPFEGCGYA